MSKLSKPIHRVLSRLGLVAEADLADALSRSLGLPGAREIDFPMGPVLAGRVTPGFLRGAPGAAAEGGRRRRRRGHGRSP